MLPTHRPPTHPGEMLLKEFLEPEGITQVDLSRRTGMSVQRINTIISGKRSVTAETAILLACEFGNSPQFWMGLQMDYDLWYAARSMQSAG